MRSSAHPRPALPSPTTSDVCTSWQPKGVVAVWGEKKDRRKEKLHRASRSTLLSVSLRAAPHQGAQLGSNAKNGARQERHEFTRQTEGEELTNPDRTRTRARSSVQQQTSG